MAWRGRYVFVGGLHRSGTSLVARLLAEHPDVCAIAGAPVPEQEGVYLQGAIPHTARHGIPGAFAEDPVQHLTEQSHFNTAEVRGRLEAEWAPWFQGDGRWRMEKSPVNLLRMRLYQQLFPLAQFIVVVRHPGAVAAATRKWSDRSEADLLAHWDTAHEIALSDLGHLHCALVVRYEDLCLNADAQRARLHAFLGLAPHPSSLEIRDGTGDYAGSWNEAVSPVAARLGYGADRYPIRDLPPDLACRHPLRSIREATRAVRFANPTPFVNRSRIMTKTTSQRNIPTPSPNTRPDRAATDLWDGASDTWETARNMVQAEDRPVGAPERMTRRDPTIRSTA